jgi:hypothetical protein
MARTLPSLSSVSSVATIQFRRRLNKQPYVIAKDYKV